MSQLAYAVTDVRDDTLDELMKLSDHCDTLVDKAVFRTGSISLASMVYLHTLVERFQPTTIIEIGTFIGKSTYTMLDVASVHHLYTCDMHNDCLPTTPRLTCFPGLTSTQMLAQLVEKGVKADFFFFDGRLSAVDLSLILRLSTWNTVYACDDYHENVPPSQFQYGKGVANIGLLAPYLKEHTLIDPPETVADVDGFTTIAALIPKELV